MLHADSAHRIAALLLAEEFDDLSAPPAEALRLRALAFLVLFLAVALHAARDTGSLATSAPVPPRWTTSAQQDPTKRVHGMAHTNTLTKAAAAAALSIGSLASAQEAVQWRVEDGGNGHWYALIAGTTPIHWETARLIAEDSGGYLACPSTSAENAWVHGTLASRPEAWNAQGWVYGPWIGGYRDSVSGSQWNWLSGDSWSFESWHPSQPDSANQTVLSYGGGGPAAATWADTGAEEPVTSYLIEWSADCNNDGLVDYGQIRAGQLPDVNGNNIPDGCEDGGGQYPAVQWSTATGGNGHWYQPLLVTQGIGWSAARLAAEATGGQLACAESVAEKQYLIATFIPTAYPNAWVRQAPWTDANFGPWLGGTQLPGSSEPFGGWQWITGSGFDPTELGCCDNVGCAGAEDRLHLLLVDGAVSWNDLPDTWSCGEMPRSLLIEWSADCNKDGLVDFGQIRAGELDDANGNNIPDCCEGGASCNCPGDVIPDGVVDGVDLAAVLGQWGSAGDKSFSADANGDGTVDAGDLSIVLNGWGACP